MKKFQPDRLARDENMKGWRWGVDQAGERGSGTSVGLVRNWIESLQDVRNKLGTRVQEDKFYSHQLE